MLQCRYRWRALLGFSRLPSQWFSWDWPINDHLCSLRATDDWVENDRSTVYHFRVTMGMAMTSSQKPSSVTLEAPWCYFSRWSGYNVTREETSKVAAFQGLVRVAHYIFLITAKLLPWNSFFDVKECFLGTVLYTVAFKILLIMQLLNYLNSTDTNCIIKASRKHLKIVLYKLKTSVEPACQYSK